MNPDFINYISRGDINLLNQDSRIRPDIIENLSILTAIRSRTYRMPFDLLEFYVAGAGRQNYIEIQKLDKNFSLSIDQAGYEAIPAGDCVKQVFNFWHHLEFNEPSTVEELRGLGYKFVIDKNASCKYFFHNGNHCVLFLSNEDTNEEIVIDPSLGVITRLDNMPKPLYIKSSERLEINLDFSIPKFPNTYTMPIVQYFRKGYELQDALVLGLSQELPIYYSFQIASLDGRKFKSVLVAIKSDGQKASIGFYEKGEKFINDYGLIENMSDGERALFFQDIARFGLILGNKRIKIRES